MGFIVGSNDCLSLLLRFLGSKGSVDMNHDDEEEVRPRQLPTTEPRLLLRFGFAMVADQLARFRYHLFLNKAYTSFICV
jgi:hypothetical protein